LAEALKVNKCLRELVLDCCGIDVEGCKGLTEALKVNRTLAKVDLADNNLLTAGIVALAEGIMENKGLKELNLTNTGVGVKASEKLAEALIVNDVLEALNVSSNQVRNHGCKKLSEMLSKNQVLRTLDLSFNNISAIGLSSMMEALGKARSEATAARDVRRGERVGGWQARTFRQIRSSHHTASSADSTKGGRAKSLDLDVILTGNQYSTTKGEVENSQVVIPPKLARSKITWDHSTDDSLDRTMWSKKKENDNFVRRPSFSAAAGEAFDIVDGGSKFSMTNNMITSKSMESFGIITTEAEPVDVPRWRQNMEEHGNDVGKIKGPDTWNEMFKFEEMKKATEDEGE
jgi:hypothetical protein